MENKILGVIVASFIAILVGVILLGQLSNQNYLNQNLDTVTSDAAVLTNTTCTQITTGCIDTLTNVKNLSVTLSAANYSLCRSNSGNIDGVQLVSISTFLGNTLNTTYTQSPNCMYVGDSTSRVLLNIIGILFALAVLIIAYYYLRQSGIFDFF